MGIKKWWDGDYQGECDNVLPDQAIDGHREMVDGDYQVECDNVLPDQAIGGYRAIVGW